MADTTLFGSKDPFALKAIKTLLGIVSWMLNRSCLAIRKYVNLIGCKFLDKLDAVKLSKVLVPIELYIETHVSF